jgi:hypothetical protein
MDMTTLIIIVAIIALVVFLMNRNRMASRGTPYGTGPYARGEERPTYDDPNYTSGGSIGGAPPTGIHHERSVGGPDTSVSNRPTHDDPNYRSGGSIGG